MKFRSILSAAIMAGFCLAALPAEAAPLIGYVDLEKAMLRVDEGQAARAKLEKTLKAKQQELDKKKSRLQALTQKLAEGKITDKERKELNEERAKLEEVFRKDQAELAQLERKTFGQIMQRMRKVISDIGKKGNYTLILEVRQNRLLFAQDHLDLTNEVIRKYNAAHRKKGK